jgi:Acetokinase family
LDQHAWPEGTPPGHEGAIAFLDLLPIRTLAARLPDLPLVACFDTGFHCVQSTVARAFALPRELSDDGVRRYGFHGLSYEYIASVLPQYDARAAAGRTMLPPGSSRRGAHDRQAHALPAASA